MADNRDRAIRHHGDRRVTAAAAFLAIVLLLIAVAPTAVFLSIRGLGDRILHEIDPLEDSRQRIRASMVEQQIGERGFIIAGDERFLEPYERARAEETRLWETAEGQAVALGGEAPALLARERQSAGAWQTNAAERGIALVRAGRRDEAERFVASGEGQELFDRFRRDDDALASYIENLHGDAVRRRERLAEWLNLILIALSIVGLAGLVLLYYISNLSRGYLLRAIHTEEVSRAKDEFLSIASHELKTPITVIKGQAQIILRRVGRQPDGSREGADKTTDRQAIVTQAEAIDRQATGMTQLIEQLLDVSRIELDRFALHREICDVVAVAGRVIELLTMLTRGRSIELDAQPHAILVDIDEARIEQVLTNLISNAIKYSPEGDPVYVRLMIEGACMRASVRDAGIGIPIADQPLVFSRFYRATNARATSISGMGVGLYVSKAIIVQHGGTMMLTSAEGEGSTFSFTLPLAPDPVDRGNTDGQSPANYVAHSTPRGVEWVPPPVNRRPSLND